MMNVNTSRFAFLRRVGAGALLFALAGCAANRVDTTASIQPDYHQRHAVALADGTEKLEVFVQGSSRLDEQQRALVRQFADLWQRRGQGPIVAMVPTGNGHELQAAATLDAIRRTLLEARVTSGLRIGSYPAEPGLTAPIQLSFPSIEAQVHDCGDWTEDVRATTYSNTSYPNFGCGTPKTLAAQIDDPRDLVRPRAEAASDVVSRSNAVNALRANSGKDIGAIGGTGSTTTTSSGN